MASSNAVKEVEDTLPGLRLKVETHSRSKRIGRIQLVCTIEDDALWDKVVKKLDGLKLFNTFENEVLDALGHAVDLKQELIDAANKDLRNKDKQIAALGRELAEIRSLISSLGMDLGLE